MHTHPTPDSGNGDLQGFGFHSTSRTRAIQPPTLVSSLGSRAFLAIGGFEQERRTEEKVYITAYTLDPRDPPSRPAPSTRPSQATLRSRQPDGTGPASYQTEYWHAHVQRSVANKTVRRVEAVTDTPFTSLSLRLQAFSHLSRSRWRAQGRPQPPQHRRPQHDLPRTTSLLDHDGPWSVARTIPPRLSSVGTRLPDNDGVRKRSHVRRGALLVQQRAGVAWHVSRGRRHRARASLRLEHRERLVVEHGLTAVEPRADGADPRVGQRPPRTRRNPGHRRPERLFPRRVLVCAGGDRGLQSCLRLPGQQSARFCR